MGFFGKKKTTKTNNNNDYVHTMEDGSIPVATPVYPTTTTTATTTYTSSAAVAPSAPPMMEEQQETPSTRKQTFIYHIPPPQQQQQQRQQQFTPQFLRVPVVMQSCPFCRQCTRTRIRTVPSVATFVAVVFIFLLFWPLCWIPLVIDACKQTDHYCVACGNRVATVPAFQDCCVKQRG